MDKELSVLLEDVRNTLRITWTDEDENLLKLIERGKAYLQNLCGASFDFDEESDPKSLLLERCRYAYNNALDEFEKNFQHELSRLILNVAIGKVGVIHDSTSQGSV